MGAPGPHLEQIEVFLLMLFNGVKTSRTDPERKMYYDDIFIKKAFSIFTISTWLRDM